MTTSPSGVLPPSTAASHPVRPGRWRQRSAIVLILLVLAWFCRAPLLRCVPMLLIVNVSDGHSDDVLIVIDGNESYDEAARRLTANPAAKIWLFDRLPNRLQRRGILPPTLECSRLSCEAAGINADRINEPPVLISGTRHLLDEVNRQLTDSPSLHVGLVVNEWNSRWLAGQVFGRIASNQRRRVQIVPVADRGVQRSSWWHTKPGRRRVAEATLKLAADWIIRDRDFPFAEVSDDDLRRAAGGLE